MRIDELSDAELAELQPLEFVAVLASIQRTRNKLDGYEARVLAAADASKTAQASGDTDLADTHSRNTGASKKSSSAARRRAKALAKQPDVGQALSEGDITAEQADLLARAEVPDETRSSLLEQASNESTDATRQKVRDAEQAASPDDPEERFRRQRRDRSASAWTDQAGMWNLHARLDPEAGSRMQACLDATVQALWQHDKNQRPESRRTPAQRTADALTELVTGIAGEAEQPAQGRNEGSDGHEHTARGHGAEPADAPHRPAEQPRPDAGRRHARVHVTIDLATLRASGAGAGTTAAGDELSAATVRRLACDAGVIPVVLGGHGQPLDFGRERRSVSPAQRAALLIRDRGCLRPACKAPPNHCDAHHVRHWADGGPTDLANLMLLCHRHHHFLHEGGMQVTAAGDGTWIVAARSGRELHRLGRPSRPDQACGERDGSTFPLPVASSA